MTKTIAEIRRDDRIRKRLARARNKELGIPSGAAINSAIVEALSFAILKGEYTTQPALSDIVPAAKAILVDRQGYSHAYVKDGIRSALLPRPEHRWRAHTPTIFEERQR